MASYFSQSVYVIYFEAPISSDLASGSPSELAPVSFDTSFCEHYFLAPGVAGFSCVYFDSL